MVAESLQNPSYSGFVAILLGLPSNPSTLLQEISIRYKILYKAKACANHEKDSHRL